MSNVDFYWVVQILSGRPILHGPYLTKGGASNAFKRVKGGEVYPPFKCRYGLGEERSAYDAFIEYQERKHL